MCVRFKKVDLLWFRWFCSNYLGFMFLDPVKATCRTFAYGVKDAVFSIQHEKI